MRRFALLVFGLTCGCFWPRPPVTRMSTTPPPAPTGFPATTAASITTAPNLGQPCEVIAFLDIRAPSDDEATAYEALRRSAMQLGGDAVVDARFERATDMSWHANGIVVRAKPLDGRPYDVIARIDVQTPQNAGDKGLDALRNRGRELGADKLVDIRFARDGSDGLSHITALAIRYRR